MILHICLADKFIPDFINFVSANFDEKNHEYVIFDGDLKKYPIKESSKIWHCNSKLRIFKMLIAMQSAEKIILHSIFSNRLVRLLAIMPWLLKKSYWVMWGGDLYHYQSRQKNLKSDRDELVRTFVIKRLGHFITHVKGDYELAKEWYGASGQWHECFMYPSNLYKDYPLQPKVHDTINIQVGNSADPSNNHLEVLAKLKAFRDQAIRIYVPLSYGNQQYAQDVIAYGVENFGDKFIPLKEFMQFNSYIDFLSKIDIAIFNHQRQQAMGNITSLLGLEKKVFIRSDITSWKFINQLGIKIYDVNFFNLEKISASDAKENKLIIRKNFSEANLSKQLQKIFL